MVWRPIVHVKDSRQEHIFVRVSLDFWSLALSHLQLLCHQLPTMNLKSYIGLNPYDDDDKEERAGGKKDNTVVIAVGTVVGIAVMFGLAWSRA